ncbi:general stress protein [Paenibacillus rigui]|uniref:General stress protein 17M-like domain-containing protein n=1 Tax=Paenibacillus rigui TaxID=554312 RepID=A0A229UVH2_9BACL|nr:general stress protein [Paenibacillus rigui]OXM87597.1 hypothetical protein CF651_04550 [Paenibacillus rigui]
MESKVKLVTREEQAIEEIRAFRREGYALEEIYVLAHDDKTVDGLASLTDTNKIGLYEEGIANTFANLFRSRGDQLRSKMTSLGLSETEAEHYEKELDQGKIMVMVWFDETDSGSMEAHRRVRRRDDYVVPSTGIYMADRHGPNGIV